MSLEYQYRGEGSVMNVQEKLEFLKSMGYGGSILYGALGRTEPMHGQIKTEQKEPKESKEKRKNLFVDKSEILNLHRIFNE